VTILDKTKRKKFICVQTLDFPCDLVNIQFQLFLTVIPLNILKLAITITRLPICCLLGGTIPIFDRNLQKLLIKSGVKTRFLWVCEQCPAFCRKKDDQSNDNPPIQDIEVEQVISHQGFDKRSKINDIALIRLKKDVTFEKIRNVETICLPVVSGQMIENIKAPNNKNPNMIISGWGQTEFSNKISDVLLEARVPYVDPEQCSRNFNEIQSKYGLKTIAIEDTHLVK
jgi:Trypsin